MDDFLRKLIDDAKKRIENGYYEIYDDVHHQPVSLKKAIKSAKNNAVIAEIKPISPARGPLCPSIDPVDAALKLERGGAVGLSILTEPDNFGGRLENLRRVRSRVKLPLLMKDVIVDRTQIEAGKKTGADCILLIESVFSERSANVQRDLIDLAHEHGLEVLLEVHSEDEFSRALSYDADIVGINNRNLATLETDLNTTKRVLAGREFNSEKVVISESGLETTTDVRYMKSAHVDGFLVGSSIMLSEDMERKVRELVLA